MTNRAKLLAQRRILLVTECALQRITLLGQTRSIGSVTHLLKTGSSLIGHLKNLPGWVGPLLAGLVIVVPGRAVSWAKKGLTLWQIWRAISYKLNKP